MKKMLVLALSAFLLVGCNSGETSSGSSQSSSGSSQTSSSQSSSGSQGGEAVSSRVVLEKNVKYRSSFSSTPSSSYESYKLDNAVMIVNNDTVIYGKFNKNTTKFDSYIGELSGGKVNWNSTVIKYSLWELYDETNQGFLVEYDDANSYFSSWCTEKQTDETKDIHGKTCRKYVDGELSYWVEESTMLIYEKNQSSKTYKIEEIDTNITSFPYNVPTV